MKKIKATMFVSLDGVVEDPHLWHFPYFNDQMGVAVNDVMGGVDTLLLGRVTYDSFAGAWPEREAAGGEDAPFAKALGDARKVVASRQDLDFSWRNTERIEGDLLEAAAALKGQSGGTHIAISGSPSIVRQLLAAGLLDELHLLVHPIAVGKGLKLFAEDESIPLKLLSAETFETGVLNLVYGPEDSAPEGTYEEAKAHIARDPQD